MERLIAERGRPDGADDSDEDLPADSDDDDMPVMMAANMEDADEDLPNLHEDEVEEAFIESDDSDNSLESAEEMEEEWESGNEDVEEETVQVEEEDEEDDEEGNVMVIEDEAIQHQSGTFLLHFTLLVNHSILYKTLIVGMVLCLLDNNIYKIISTEQLEKNQ